MGQVKSEIRLPSIKFLKAALIDGLDANSQPKQQQKSGGLEKLSVGLSLPFFFLVALVASLRHFGRPSDQIVVYLLLPLTLIVTVLYLLVFSREGFRLVKRMAGNGEEDALDRDLKNEDALAAFLEAFSSTERLKRSSRLLVDVEIKKDLIGALGIAAVVLAAILAASTASLSTKSGFFGTYYPVAAILIWSATVLLAALKLAGDIRIPRRLAWVLSSITV